MNNSTISRLHRKGSTLIIYHQDFPPLFVMVLQFLDLNQERLKSKKVKG